jgi:hypothetical protein
MNYYVLEIFNLIQYYYWSKMIEIHNNMCSQFEIKVQNSFKIV